MELHSYDGKVRLYVRALDERTSDNRPRYFYSVTVGAALPIVGDDISGGCGFAPDEQDAMDTLLAFLGAWGEAIDYGADDSENRDLFPLAAWDLVGPYIEELQCQRSDMED